MTDLIPEDPLLFGRSRRLAGRLRASPALHLTDQALSSGTNFLATTVVARHASQHEFGVFSIFLIAYYLAAGFNRSVPNAIAMTLDWDDERARSGYFFIPAVVLGLAATVILLPVFLAMDHSFLLLAILFVPLLLQDAVRMHAFAIQKPQRAIVSDAVWLFVQLVGFLFVTTAGAAATVWILGSVCGALVFRPWLHVRWQRRPIKSSVLSSSLEFIGFAGLGYLSPLLALPFINVKGVGALQGATVLRGPIILLVQGLIVHKMAGAPIQPEHCVREARRLSVAILIPTLLSIPGLLLFRGWYGPRLFGLTWPSVEPLLLPTITVLIVCSVAFGPATVARKMGLFELTAKVQIALVPCFLGLALAGAAAFGAKGFLYGNTIAYAIYIAVWWPVLMRIRSRGRSVPEPEPK